MDSRREFLKKAALLSGAAGVASVLPPSISKAFSIDPAVGTTWKDAEHVVILMQENRSFDHCYGTLRGVRGFNDPRAMTLPNKNSVFLQTNAKGETFAPFRLNIKDTNATWMGSLPHGWTDQTDVRNHGACDNWLEAKAPGKKEWKDMPLTMGFYNREDLSFYYSLADAFTVCDQNFCSSLTGTTPNRLYLWSGKTRDDDKTVARVRNGEADYDSEAGWKTFPERLEENNISWKIYQNEISVGVGFEGEEDSWLSNFTDNPIEFFSQYNVRFHAAYRNHLPKRIAWLEAEIKKTDEQIATAEGEALTRLRKTLENRKQELTTTLAYQKKYTRENYERLSKDQRNIHENAFTTNINDPDYHSLAELKYNDNGTDREMKVPKGDVLHQFRNDVKNGKLPTVSWLVAPENFSDHPGAPWYGAWYLSEAVDILTENPEVWKKTIFILCYDENDGYFDHVPPFVPPVPNDPLSGKVSKGIDVNAEYVSLDDDLERQPADEARGGPIGLGYRVPLVIASPWSRGGAVCSQVFDHTSILMFLEKFLSYKTGKEIKETNISAWRRTVCGDLTSTFTTYHGEKYDLPKFVEHDSFVESIHKSKFKDLPSGFRALTPADIERSKKDGVSSLLKIQEQGTRASRALPYELYVDGKVSADKTFEMKLESCKNVFGDSSAGAPFHVYSYGKTFKNRAYAVAAGDVLTDQWSSSDLGGSNYHLKVHGPNGFFREFRGEVTHSTIEVICSYEQDATKKITGNIELTITNRSKKTQSITVVDKSYKQQTITKKISAGAQVMVPIASAKFSGWYDASVIIDGDSLFENRFAGRVETGKQTTSDPGMA